MSRTDHRFGWIPDLPDRRDHLYSTPSPVLMHLPPQANLTAQCPPVYDQGRVGSCTANAIGAAIEFDRLKQKLSDVMPSRLFIYYNERAMEGTVNSDAGAMIRDGIKSVNKLGVCPESEWSYDGDTPSDQGGPNSKVFQKPPKSCYTDALKDRATGYQRLVQMNNQLRGCLAEGYPFVYGITVYESFPMETQTGAIPLPSDGEKTIGGHAMLAVGYDDAQQVFLVRNSWGAGWGNKGYGTIPYAYLLDRSLASDFWTIRAVSPN